MLEFDLVDDVAGRMVMDMYRVIRSDHICYVNEGLITEAGADEAVRMAIEKLYHAMKEVDNEH